MTARERILQSAKELFAKKGYKNTSVEEIVQQAGISKGGFYFYFKSKSELMKELIEQMAQRTKDIMRKWLQKETSAEEAIKGHIMEFLRECYSERHIAYIFFFELLCGEEEFRKLHKKHMEEIRGLLTQMIKRGYERKEFLCGSVETLTNLIVGYIKLIYMEELLLKDKPLEEILARAEEGLELIMRGVKCVGS